MTIAQTCYGGLCKLLRMNEPLQATPVTYYVGGRSSTTPPLGMKGWRRAKHHRGLRLKITRIYGARFRLPVGASFVVLEKHYSRR